MDIPYKPIRVEFDIPVYSSIDIQNFGEPDNYGIWRYTVIEQDPSPLVYHKCTDKKLFPYHQYNRLERFKAVLNFLLGHGKVPFKVYESVIEKLDIVDEHGELWQNIAKTLGETGNWKYVNRIPTIMIMLGYGACFETCKVISYTNPRLLRLF
jgi:hypothetical protein